MTPHIADTDFQHSGADDLLSYMGRDHDLRNRTGLVMSDAEIEDFLDKSDYYGFERHYIISPENNDLSDEEMGEATRDSVTEFFDGETVDYCYAVHRDTESLHAHVALTGKKEELFMDRDDLKEFERRSDRLFRERGREYDRDRELLRELEHDRDQRDRDHGREHEYDRTREREHDRDDDRQWRR